jgi:hypothetical protein
MRHDYDYERYEREDREERERADLLLRWYEPWQLEHLRVWFPELDAAIRHPDGAYAGNLTREQARILASIDWSRVR